MFDFDVRGAIEPEGHRANDVLGLGTVQLSAPVAEVPRAPALSIAPELSVGAAIEALRRARKSAAIVAREQRPLGVVTERDLLAHADLDPEGRSASVANVMSIGHEALRASDSVGASMRQMCATRQWHLPIVAADGRLVGSIDVADLVTWLRDRMTVLSVESALE